MVTYLTIGLLSGAVYGLMAMGFVLVYKGSRIFNLAAGEIGGVGLYIAWDFRNSLPAPVIALIGVAVAAAVGVVMERVLVRRVVDRAPLAGVAMTLGAALTFAYAEALIWGLNVKTFPSPVGTARVHLGSVVTTTPRIAAVIAAGAVAVGLGVFLRRTRFGLAMRASTSDTVLARISGVKVNQARAATWAIAGALSGLSAILLAPVSTFSPLSNTLILVRALAAALLGGLTSLSGALAGGLAVGVVESLVISQTHYPGAPDVAILALILVTLLVKPEGLLGETAG
jgi:branched-subunit amino acid ABC-type transport system permease component